MKDTSAASAQSSRPSTGGSQSTTTGVDPVDQLNSNSPMLKLAQIAGVVSETVPPPPEPKEEPVKWNKFDDPRPYVTVSGLVLNRRGEFILLHRSEKVRSARNCWSLPSGLHEVGLSMRDQFAQEIREELGLIPIPEKSTHIGMYENIRPDGRDIPGWHWVIAVMAMRVENFHSLVNKEPDKHDQIEVVQIHQDWVNGRKWAPCLGEFLVHNKRAIQDAFNRINF